MTPRDDLSSISDELFRPPPAGSDLEAGREKTALLALLDALPVGIFWKDRDSRYLGCNKVFARDAGLETPADIVGKTDLDLAWSSLAEKVRADDREIMESGVPRLGYEDPATLRDGRRVWHRKNKLPIRDAGGAVIGILGTYEDVSWERIAEERLAFALEGSGVGLWDWNVKTGQVEFNERWAEICGYTLAELEPLSIETWASLCHPEDLAKSEAAIKEHFEGRIPYYECEARMRHKDGRWIWVLDRGKLVARDAEGQPLRMAGTHLDISARKRLEEDLLLAATRDKLTGAFNRRTGLEQLERELKGAQRRSSELAICFVDVDGLKEANDTLGHAAGDALLVEASRALQANLRETDILARLGGDEFLLILPDCPPGEAEAIWERVLATARGLDGEAPNPDRRGALGLSHGFAFFRAGETTGADELVARADAAMYADKRARKAGRASGGSA